MGPSFAKPVKPDDDPERTFSIAEQEQLSRNLQELLLHIQRGDYSSHMLDSELLISFHRQIFADIRDHAGRCRGPDFGSEHVYFGPRTSEHRNHVPEALSDVFTEARRSLTSFEQNPNHPDFERAALHLAAWVHARVIQIHPFEDGNGRASRALMSAILVRVGLRPIPIEAPKQEYLAALNRYHDAGDISSLVDLCLRLYPGLLE